MVARPDHSHCGRAGLAIVAPQFVADRIEESPVRIQVGHHRLRQFATPRDTFRELVVPRRDLFCGGDDLPAGASSVAFIGPVALPQFEDSVAGEAERGGTGDESRYFGEWDALG